MSRGKLYGAILLVVLLVFALIVLRSCRSGNHPQHLDDVAEPSHHVEGPSTPRVPA